MAKKPGSVGRKRAARPKSAGPKPKPKPTKRASNGKTKVPIPALSTAPIEAPGTPGAYRARVRMYRQGLGDCFLVTFPRSHGAPFHMLIDCGALGRSSEFMTSVVKHIRDTVQTGPGQPARLDVVVCTHEHKDHLSGFNQARGVFDDEFEFGAVWLGWTENLTQPEIRAIKQARRRAVARLQAAVADSRVAGLGLDGIADASSVLQFSRDSAGAATIADALEYLKERGKKAGNLKFLEPGQPPLELDGVDDVRVFVLGPPKDPLLLKGSEVTVKHKREGVVYHLSRTGASGVDAVSLALSAGPGASGEGDRYHPFGAEHRIQRNSPPRSTEAGKPNPYFKALAGFLAATYNDPKQAWRKIDHDWLNAFGQLALDLDNDTNNTSLVLAFEFVRTREVLLFVGDAQVGNWLSWADVTFSVPGRDTPLPAHDILSRAVFYKVGHHCSHNATLKKGGLELMTRDDIVAFVPLDMATAKSQGTKGWAMPAAPLYKALRERACERVVISDVSESLTPAAAAAGVLATDAYIDYFLK